MWRHVSRHGLYDDVRANLHFALCVAAEPKDRQGKPVVCSARSCGGSGVSGQIWALSSSCIQVEDKARLCPDGTRAK